MGREPLDVGLVGRKANKVIVLHELVHHLRGCNGISNSAYCKNPYTEEMATQFISATVFSESAKYQSVVSDVYTRTSTRLPQFRLDLLAFQEAAQAVKTIAEDRMDSSSEKTQKTFFMRAVYDLSRDRSIPRHIGGFDRFAYLKYPLGKALGLLMYSRFLDIGQTDKDMLLLAQGELVDLILSMGSFERWKNEFFAVVSYLRKRLEPDANGPGREGASGIYMGKDRSLA